MTKSLEEVARPTNRNENGNECNNEATSINLLENSQEVVIELSKDKLAKLAEAVYSHYNKLAAKDNEPTL